MNNKRSPWLIALTVCLGLLIHSTSAGALDISITDTGFQPASVTILAGEGVHWTNDSGDTQTVTADGGLFDSGPLQPGAGFSVALAIPGVHTYRSSSNPDFEARFHVVLEELSADDDALANDHIPDITFPLQLADDMSPHPDWGFLTSRTRILLGFTDTATVTQANAALQAATVAIIGGLPEVDILLVAAQDTPDFSGLTAALDTLRADPAVDFAAISSEMELQELPRPADETTGKPPYNWTWARTETASGDPLGDTGNWNLEASRLPQAWNLRETIQRRGHVESTRTAVVDSGFEPHEDMIGTRSEHVLCKPTPDGPKCTTSEPGDHGQLVTGIIAAVYDNDSVEEGRSLGLSGVNPVARVSALEYGFEGGTDAFADLLEIIKLVAEELSDIKVVNLSVKHSVPHAVPGDQPWWDSQGVFPVCGPGDNDDNTAGANDFCTPNNDDDWLEEMANLGKATRNIAEYASQKGIIIVQAAGNDSGQTTPGLPKSTFCLGSGVNVEGCTFERLKAVNVAEFAWASENWVNPAIANPIIIVEAIGIDLGRSVYSNIEGDVSAPADDLVKLALDNLYAQKGAGGTSSATPHVAGLVGYMSAFDPSLTIDQIKDHLLGWARADTTDGAESRIDAFATMLSLPGAAKALVDVNDMSKDGNRRVVLGPPDPDNLGGVELGLDMTSSSDIDPSTGTWYRTHPDGIIDMRDFRRFRDVRLQLCEKLPPGTGECIDIADSADIQLNGPPDHPKKDLNFDRCVNQGSSDPDCPTSENVFPRFDFNGDGVFSRSDLATVPLKPDGSPADDKLDETLMTDLEVLMSQWDPDLEKTEGYAASDLPGLLLSADLEIHAQDLFGEGAGDVTVTIIRPDTNTALPTRTIPVGDFIVYTVPADVYLEINASAMVGSELIEAAPYILSVRPGVDVRFELCRRNLNLIASPATLLADGAAESSIALTLQPCPTDSLEDAVVTFTQTPGGPNHGSLQYSTVGLDPDGTATNVFTAGTEVADYEITAVATLKNGKQVQGTVSLKTTNPVKIFYNWQQTILNFSEEGSSRWPPMDPTDPAQDIRCGKATIRGTVFDPLTPPHDPVEGAIVEVLGVDGTRAATNADGFFLIDDVGLGANNSPIQVTVRATTPDFTVDKTVTVFCDASLLVEFGQPPSAPARLEGSVLDATGAPLAGVFIGSDFGGSTTTNLSGNYALEDVPTSPNGVQRTWNVTARASGLMPNRQAVSVWEGSVDELDFQLGIGDCDDFVIHEFQLTQDRLHSEFGDLVEGGNITKFRVYQDGTEIATYGMEGTLPPPVEIVPAGTIGWEECVNDFKFDAFPTSDAFPGFPPPHLTLKRQGSLEQAGSAMLLDEFVTDSMVSGTFDWQNSGSQAPADGAMPTQQFAGTVAMAIPFDQLERYQDHALPSTVFMDTVPEGLRLHGLKEIAELEYPYESSWTFTEAFMEGMPPFVTPFTHYSIGFGDVPDSSGAMKAGTHQSELMFIPRGDGSALKFSGDVSQPVTFKPDGAGGYEKYEYCEVVDRQYTSSHEYFTALDIVQDGIHSTRLWRRNSTYYGVSNNDLYVFTSSSSSKSWQHEYPMPVGPGNSKIRYAFVAIPYTDEAELEALILSGLLDPPSCEETPSLEALFDATPNPADEGSLVSFTDQSLSPGNSIVSWDWDLGNGDTSVEQDPATFYNDNGTYQVDLTVVDATGAISVASMDVTVTNLPPEGQVGDAFANEGETVDITVLLADPGEDDRQALAFRLESTNSAFPVIEDTRAAGIHTFSIGGLPAGDYPLTLTVTDKDGASDTDSGLVQILGSGTPPPPPPPPPPPTPTCDPSISLDGEEKAFLDLLNAYRAQKGLPPVEASPGLTKAAVRHASDMAANDFLDHMGSDGSTPEQRAQEEGYPSNNVSENVASGLPDGNTLLFAFMASAGHDQVMLDPLWNAVGIAREQGADWYWTVDFGETLDCPLARALPGESPASLYASAAARDWDHFVSNPPAIPENVRVLQYGGGDDPPSVLYPPVAAFVISDASPMEAETLTFTNASRDASGSLVSAILNVGDGSDPVLLGPGANHDHTYNTDGNLNVSVTATTTYGDTLTVTRPVFVEAAEEPPPPPGDFNVLISPSSQTFAPGSGSNFVVTVTAINDFSAPVTLSVAALPYGITAQFSPPTLTPSASSSLLVTATDDADTGDFDLNVTATGGGITHTTSSSVSVEFGLIPICTGTLEGVVTDTVTGNPIANARVSKSYTGSPLDIFADSNGHYTMTGLPLGVNNSPQTTSLWGLADGYWYANGLGTAACGEVNTLDIQLVPMKYGTISGFVRVGTPDPNDLTENRSVTPTDVPIEGATVSLNNNTVFSTDAAGFYGGGSIQLGYNNEPVVYSPSVAADGYWHPAGWNPVTIEADKNTVADFVLVPKCTGTISGKLIFGDTGQPIANATLRATRTVWDYKFYDTVTNANGEFSFADIELSYNNASASYTITLQYPYLSEYAPLEVYVLLERCGDHLIEDLSLQARVSNYGALEGHVTDIETGDPVADARVAFRSYNPNVYRSDQADTDGAYRIETIFLGYDDQTSNTGSATASHNDFWSSSSPPITVNSGETSTADFELLRKKFGYVAGTVRNAATQEPIAGATFTFIAAEPSQEDGSYQSGPISLNTGNTPRQVGVRASADGYWDKFVQTTVSADQTTTVDIDMIEVCQSATIVGFVYDASTQEPIEGAAISITPSSGIGWKYTDQDGNFIVEDITVGTDNSPLDVTVSVYATGYYSQSKTVTIFCGATITAEFGHPSTDTGTIEGTVTNLDTGQPMGGVFIGSGFGGSATTDSQGYYILPDAPLSAGNTDRDWQVTAIPDSFPPLSQTVTVQANTTVTLDFEFGGSANQSPDLDPVGDQVIAEGETLDVAIFADDPDGDTITLWAAGLPAFADFTDHGGGLGTLTLAPAFGDMGEYPVVEIFASDGDLSDKETFTISVLEGNQPPVAVAGGPYTANEGDTITLDGSGSSDPADDSLSYHWQFESESFFDVIVEISSDDDLNGTALLTVEDPGGLTDADTAMVIFNNVPPGVAAGPDATVAVGESFTGAGNFSDPGNDTWTATVDYGDGAGPEPLGLHPNKSLDLEHIYVNPGTYPVVVCVADDDGGVGCDSLSVTVPIPNRPPVLQPIGNLFLEEGDILDIAVSATDPDGDTLTLWATGLPAFAGFTDNGDGTGFFSLAPVHSDAGDHPGIEVVVSDGALTDSETISIMVIGWNQPPVADAGVDRNVETATEVTLDGSNSFDPDGDMITYDWGIEWSLEGVPAGSALTDGQIQERTTPVPSFIPDVDGIYDFRLVVNDGQADSEPDFVRITAATPNIPPNAHAGPDQSGFVGEQVLLDGSGSDDPDSGPEPLSYTWTFVQLPTESSLENTDIAGANQAQASFVPDVGGTYVLALQVFDGEDGGEDDVTITVSVPNVAPNANAGEDQEVGLGEEVILDGTASDDPDNAPEALAFTWRFVSVADGSSLTNSDLMDVDTPVPHFTPDVAGTYVLELEVSDGEMNDFDNVMVTCEGPPEPLLCDLDGSADVDLYDIGILLGYRNQQADACLECDIDGDGMITVLDARRCVLECTRPRCVP